MITEHKINKAIKLLRKAENLALKYSEKGFFLAFSGGKDSQCIYHLAKLAGVKFTAHYSVTSIDPPELMRFIKEKYPDVVFDRPKYTFYNLCRKKKSLPTQKIRFCCQELKETGGAGMVCITGIRKAESIKRGKRKEVEISNYKFSGTLDEFNEIYSTDKGGIVHKCIKGKDKVIINPIIDWSDNEVWSFIRNFLKVPYCELYDKGKHRLGCLLCPMSSTNEQRKALMNYPNIKTGFLRVIKDLKQYYKNGVWELDEEEILNWYISKKSSKEFLEDRRQLYLF